MFLYRPFDLDSRVEREARSLVAAGYEVEVIALPSERLPEREVRDGYAIRRVQPAGPAAAMLAWLSRTRTGPLAKLAFRGSALFRLRTWARRAASAITERPALVIAHDMDGLLAGARLKRRLRTPLIYDAHELFPDMAAAGRPSYELRGWAWWERRLVRHADGVLAVTPSRAHVMADRLGIDLPRVIRNVPETSAISTTPADYLRRGVPPGKLVLLYSGGVQPARGLEQAIAALALLPECILVVMGAGENAYLDELRAAALDAGVADRVLWREPVRPQNVVSVTAGADVGLVLNRNVGLNNYLSLPNKVFEYLAAGLPVVVSDSPDLTDLLLRYDAGVTCDPEDPAAIADALGRVLADAERLRANARRAAPELTWERESRDFVDAVEELIVARAR
jgi:glycosyltransferase involved in cell wall biosynthesis